MLIPFGLGYVMAAMLIVLGLTFVWMIPGLFELLKLIIRREEDKAAPRKIDTARRRFSLLLRSASLYDAERREAVSVLKRRGRYVALIFGLSTLLAVSSPSQGLFALCAGTVIALISLVVGAVRQIRLNRILVSEELRPRRLSKREAAVARQQEHDCVVFPRRDHSADDEEDDETINLTLFGNESPFVGAGELIHQWNPPMNIQLLRDEIEDEPLHEREYAVPPFQTHELVDHLRRAVEQLRDDEVAIRLPAHVRDRVYIAENDVSVERDLLGEKCIAPTHMQGIINGQDPKKHHFLEVSVPTIGGELVATVLLQVRVQGRTLSLSFAACALTRTPRSFQRVNEFGWHGSGAVVWSALEELVGLPKQIATFWKVAPYVYALRSVP
ncbi:hypothetical protein [Streptomyces marincola]|uniref:hypothetical protein n=1 Tax=Streptomyces marincola TaxID=2878388 RepID=UPI001CF27154|nr:hypothetical protein [Streptomyces marincola]UCM91266.1 hypothetical protein LC193_26815 [Streptomyces marincola]